MFASTIFFTVILRTPLRDVEKFLEDNGIRKDTYRLELKNNKKVYITNPQGKGLSFFVLVRIFGLTGSCPTLFPTGFYPQLSDAGKRRVCEWYLAEKSKTTQFTLRVYAKAMAAKVRTRERLKVLVLTTKMDGKLGDLFVTSKVLMLLQNTTKLSVQQLMNMTLAQIVNKVPWRSDIFKGLIPIEKDVSDWCGYSDFSGNQAVDKFTPGFFFVQSVW